MNKTFEELGLNNNLLQAIKDLGFEHPTPIQQETIPLLINNTTDLVALAQTGTGKTAAFGLPLVQLINPLDKFIQGLILCPTRELCLQISKDLENFAKYTEYLKIVAVYGGANIETQIKQLKMKPQIVVATPGRLIDLMERKKIDLSQVKYAILDEADEMLNMGFKEAMDTILETTPETKTTWLFSATMPKEISQITKTFMNKPVEITIGRKNEGAANISHEYYVVHAKDKYLALKRIIDFYPDIFGMIFCRTKAETQMIAEHLMKDGYSADALHGDLSQKQRDAVMAKFRLKNLQILVATDVAARGIDVDNVTHVINYNLPEDIESYTHRSGRTARAGKTGISILILDLREVKKLKLVEQQIGRKFEKKPIPTAIQVCEKQMLGLVDKVKQVRVEEEEMQNYLPVALEQLQELTKEELIKRFLSIEFNRFLDYYRNNAIDLNANLEKEGGTKGITNKNTVRFFINIGEKDGLDRFGLRDFITEVANLRRENISAMHIKDTYSFFESDAAVKQKVIEGVRGTMYKNRIVRLEVSEMRQKTKQQKKEEHTYKKLNNNKSFKQPNNKNDEYNQAKKHY